jgi:hypothetical protein
MTTTLTVQDEPLTPYPDYAPLPNQYWTFPVSAENRQWYQMTWPFLNQGGYLQNFNDWSPDVLAPHVMWKKPVDIGGVVGGPLGTTNYYEGSAYEAKSGTPIIIGNYLFITGYRIGQRTTDGTTCFDLYTGEEIWHMDDRIRFAWMMQVDSGNMHAIIPYLVSTGSTYRFYDPKTGTELFEIEGARSGINYFTYNADSPMFKPNTSGTWPGTWFVWYVNSNADGQHGIQVTLWNSTKCFEGSNWITYQVTPRVTELAQWAPPSAPTSTNAGNWSDGIMWEGPISEPLYEYLRSTMPEDGNVTNQPKSYLSSATADFESGVLVLRGSYFGEAFAGFDMTNGQLLWAKNMSDSRTVLQGRYSAAGNGKFAVQNLVGAQWVVLDDRTGVELYRTDALPGGPWNAYINYPTIHDNVLYGYGYTGDIIATNLDDGSVKWLFEPPKFNGINVLGGNNPTRNAVVGTQTLLYTGNQIKTDYQPMWPNQGTYAFNKTTGELLWALKIGPCGEGNHIATAGGYLLTYGAYTSEWFLLGRGPSKTTVSASPATATEGSPVLITGSVTDQTPISKDTPAVSDESIPEWMTYLYEQKPMPYNATGVPVTLSYIDSNNNLYEIGNVTTDAATGTYALEWTPPIPGEYTIYAEFAGSGAYAFSKGVTYIVAAEAASATPPPTPTPASATDMYVTGFGIGIIIAIVAVGLVLVLMLRKR